jgi:maltooligosyltrehalose trehalohydrolase
MSERSVSSSPAASAASSSAFHRRWPIGAEIVDSGSVHVRVWAPQATTVRAVTTAGATTVLVHDGDGYFAGVIPAAAGTRYGFKLNDDDKLYPDPASRCQPDGPHGPSQVVDPRAFAWTDQNWRGATIEGQVVYEMHVGTFTPAGTCAAAAEQLPELARIGITMIELMPLAEFEGRFGWGYDGVDLFAPTRLYGTPDDVRQFVDTAHACGIAVILDVVYNHLGPVGNYLRAFSPAYFTDKYDNEWGDAINFDGRDSAAVREFFLTNAAYWIEEFHFDGLRLDATQAIHDASPEHIVTAIGRCAREAAAPRAIVLVAENEPQDARLACPIEQGGNGLDALWNDDFHHSAMVALTGRSEAYYSDTRGEPQEFVSAAKYGYLFQGQHYHWQRGRRGKPAWGVPPAGFVLFLQNHDQVANSARGLRGHVMTSPSRWRAMTALLLLMPGTPMLFQGQEFAASAPFLYFADFEPELAAAVRNGRAEFLTQFPSIADLAGRSVLADPGSPDTFARCKLNFDQRRTHAPLYAMHADLLRLRREDAAFSRQQPGQIDGAVLSTSAFALRFFTPDHRDDRLVVVNLGADLSRTSFAEPLLAPPVDMDWAVRWSSQDPAYDGHGTPELFPDGCWSLPAESALVLAPGPQRPHPMPLVRRTA